MAIGNDTATRQFVSVLVQASGVSLETAMKNTEVMEPTGMTLFPLGRHLSHAPFLHYAYTQRKVERLGIQKGMSVKVRFPGRAPNRPPPRSPALPVAQ